MQWNEDSYNESGFSELPGVSDWANRYFLDILLIRYSWTSNEFENND